MPVWRPDYRILQLEWPKKYNSYQTTYIDFWVYFLIFPLSSAAAFYSHPYLIDILPEKLRLAGWLLVGLRKENYNKQFLQMQSHFNNIFCFCRKRYTFTWEIRTEPCPQRTDIFSRPSSSTQCWMGKWQKENKITEIVIDPQHLNLNVIFSQLAYELSSCFNVPDAKNWNIVCALFNFILCDFPTFHFLAKKFYKC